MDPKSRFVMSGVASDSPLFLPHGTLSELSPTTGALPPHALAPLFQTASVENRPAALSASMKREQEHGAMPCASAAAIGAYSTPDGGLQGHRATSSASIYAEDEDTFASRKHSAANHDGWQWRKYGEKIVKGSPNPRSYYKCSHLGCPGKKVVERNMDGEIVSTSYKEQHCHPAPPSAKVTRFRPKMARTEHADGSQLRVSTPEADSVRTMLLRSSTDALRSSLHGVSDDALGEQDEEKELACDGSELQQHLSSGGASSPRVGIGLLATGSLEVKVSNIQIHRVLEQEIQESPSKRLDALAAYAEQAERQFFHESINAHEAGPSHSKRPHLMPRTGSGGQYLEGLEGGYSHSQIALQSAYSDGPGLMDLRARGSWMGVGSAQDPPNSVERVANGGSVDDGYKWRKYGQKQVKGNPYPRSYYKCTYPSCTVRKHVELSPDDPSTTIISYEGTHEHPPPGIQTGSSSLQRGGSTPSKKTWGRSGGGRWAEGDDSELKSDPDGEDTTLEGSGSGDLHEEQSDGAERGGGGGGEGRSHSYRAAGERRRQGSRSTKSKRSRSVGAGRQPYQEVPMGLGGVGLQEELVLSHPPPPDAMQGLPLDASLQRMYDQHVMMNGSHDVTTKPTGLAWDPLGLLLSPKKRPQKGQLPLPASSAGLGGGAGPFLPPRRKQALSNLSAAASQQQGGGHPPPQLLQAIKEARQAHLALLAESGAKTSAPAVAGTNSEATPAGTQTSVRVGPEVAEEPAR